MNEEKRLNVTMADSIVLILVIIAEIVLCARSGVKLEIPLFLTWFIV